MVNPNLCVGCGACTTVCPTGALSYTYPRAPDQGSKLQTLLATYAAAGGTRRRAAAAQPGGRPGAGRASSAARRNSASAQGVPANVIPVGALACGEHRHRPLAQRAIAFGASQVAVLATARGGAALPRCAAQRRWRSRRRCCTGWATPARTSALIEAASPGGPGRRRSPAWRDTRQQRPPTAARFAVGAEKRSTLELALDHLVEHAPALKAAPEAPLAIPLPAGSPFGAIEVDKDKCTLCLACVSACPASALQDNPNAPQLRFIEKNCVQCGLCASTCPEDAISLVPRLLLAPERKQPVCSTRPSRGAAFAAPSPSARRRRSRPCSASWPAMRCSRATRSSA